MSSTDASAHVIIYSGEIVSRFLRKTSPIVLEPMTTAHSCGMYIMFFESCAESLQKDGGESLSCVDA